MKKIIFNLLSVAVAFSLSSCEKIGPGETATNNLAGNWTCSIYATDGTDDWTPYYAGEIITYNTAANVATEIWLEDGDFWGDKCKIDADNAAFSFGKAGAKYDDIANTGQKVQIWNGKITKGAVKAPVTGGTCDKIEYMVAFDDDDDQYVYYMVGYRKTGFKEDGSYDWDTATFPAVVPYPSFE